MTGLARLDRLMDWQTFAARWGRVRVRAHECQALPSHEWAFTLVDHDEPVAWIGLNSDAWPELAAQVPRTLFSAAHELAHCLAHGHLIRDGVDPDLDPALEAEASAIAAHILIPDAALRHGVADLGEREACERFRVAPRTWSKRLKEWRSRSLL